VEEDQDLAVEVAYGYVIQCMMTGKIRIQILDDYGKEMVAILMDVIYVPGLSCRLLSITRFADHGHYAVI
jgi:hypothetical protein